MPEKKHLSFRSFTSQLLPAIKRINLSTTYCKLDKTTFKELLCESYYSSNLMRNHYKISKDQNNVLWIGYIKKLLKRSNYHFKFLRIHFFYDANHYSSLSLQGVFCYIKFSRMFSAFKAPY